MAEDNKKSNKIEIVDLKKMNESRETGSERSFDANPGFEAIKNTPERVENNLENLEISSEKEGAGGPESKPGGIVQIGIVNQHQKERVKAIEKVLEADLEEIFLRMNEERRREFARQGEETAREINSLLDKGMATATKLIDLIKKWLTLIPGVNKFFVEQEAKLKADEILKKNS